MRRASGCRSALLLRADQAMWRLGLLSAVSLSLLISAAAPAWAQFERPCPSGEVRHHGKCFSKRRLEKNTAAQRQRMRRRAPRTIKDPETGVVFPGSSKCMGETARAAAVGVREATFGIDIHAVVLYVSSKAEGKIVRMTNECVKFAFRFVREVSARKIKDAWIKGFRKNDLMASDATVQKLLGIIDQAIKKRGEMVVVIKSGTVVYTYIDKSIKITDARKLGRAIKSIYLGGGSPTPKLIKDLKMRGVAKP